VAFPAPAGQSGPVDHGTVGAKAPANKPVLDALNERLETNLAPRVAQMQQVLAPARDALATVANAVSMLNWLPMLADRAPRLRRWTTRSTGWTR
jgi:hypothetical protein